MNNNTQRKSALLFEVKNTDFWCLRMDCQNRCSNKTMKKIRKQDIYIYIYIYVRHKPITLKVLLFCTCTLAPAVLPLLEAHHEFPFLDGCETCCHFHWIHSPEAKQWHFSPFLRLRKCWKLHGERCGEYCGWGWLKFSSAPKTAPWGRCDKAHCYGARSISFSTVWTFSAERNP